MGECLCVVEDINEVNHSAADPRERKQSVSMRIVFIHFDDPLMAFLKYWSRVGSSSFASAFREATFVGMFSVFTESRRVRVESAGEDEKLNGGVPSPDEAPIAESGLPLRHGDGSRDGSCDAHGVFR